MQYDPKLKKAMEEIKAIMHDAGIGGVVILHRPGFVEYLNKIDPPYACINIDNLSTLKIRAKKDMYAGGAEERNQVLADTANLLATVNHQLRNSLEAWAEIERIYTDHVGPHDHTSGSATSHEQQNN